MALAVADSVKSVGTKGQPGYIPGGYQSVVSPDTAETAIAYVRCFAKNFSTETGLGITN